MPSAPLYIIQGSSEKDITDLPRSIEWIDWKDKNLLDSQLIIGKTMQNFVTNMENHGIFNASIVKSLNTIAETIAITEDYLKDLPIALNQFRELEEFFEFLNLFNEHTTLKQELQWAHYLESLSKSNVGIKRIQRLDNEITALEKKKQIIEPQFEFLKDTETSFKKTLNVLDNKIKLLNKTYISKTTLINKLKRQIDAEKPKSDLYTEKLEELASQIPESKLSDSEDYKRIFAKLESVNKSISQYKKDVAGISEDIIHDKTKIKNLKLKLKEIKQLYAQTSPKFIEIQKSYLEISSQLKKYRDERKNLIKSQTKENAPIGLGVSPPNVRFSSIIEAELKSNEIQLSKYISTSESTPEAYKSQFLKSWNLSKKKLDIVTSQAELLSEASLHQLQMIIESIQSSLNSAFKQIGLKILFNKLPLVEQSEKSIPQYGIQFHLLKSKKSIMFEKLLPEEKFFIMCSFEYVLNKSAGIKTHVFLDSDFKIKRTKNLIEKTSIFLKNGLLAKEPEHRIVVILSKPILEETTQKDIIITTLTSK
ncbi:MAG: hypothetical protein EU530_02465 [Promethearchaeota archaeon]|nr:MAG: hypothetical protein EU530_02465 [Candidatus Lokiarchaeota archaeon]